MNNVLKQSITSILPIVDFILSPFVFAASVLFYAIRRAGVFRFPVANKVFKKVGILPIRHHYYEPLFYEAELSHSLDKAREIPGLMLNEQRQLDLLKNFHYQEELEQFPLSINNPQYEQFFYQNKFFETGDAEMYYNFIRHFKPKKIIEVGSGWSTKIALNAIRQNKKEEPSYQCKLICIEPYEHPELEKQGVELYREKVERIPVDFFKQLGDGDILFIDSSHVIRPQGDVVFEIIRLIGTLNKGVIVQFHDIFTPRDYTQGMVLISQYFWNEQYLLEAFLSYNPNFEVLCSMNHLWMSYQAALIQACPMLKHDGYPCSFWIRKVS